MRTQSPDTSPEAEGVQIELLRKATPARCFNLMRSLSKTVIQWSRQSIRQANPEASEDELALLFVAFHYNQSLADALRRTARKEKTTVTTTPDLVAAMTPAIEAFEQLGIAYHIGGSIASSTYGIPRLTLDADIIASLEMQHVRPLVTRLQTAYYIDEDAVRDAIGRRSSFNIIHFGTMLKVDVFTPKARPFDQQALRRVRKEIPPDSPRPFYLASPEDTILNKLEWYRMGNEVSDRQWNDILGVLKVRAKELDLTYLQHWAKALGVTDLLDRALTDAGLTEQPDQKEI